jgi:uncharacterized protein YggL (DUF469 family)
VDELQQSKPTRTKCGEFSGLLSVSMTSSCVEDKRKEVTLWLAASIGTSIWVKRNSGVERTRASLGVPTWWGNEAAIANMVYCVYVLFEQYTGKRHAGGWM